MCDATELLIIVADSLATSVILCMCYSYFRKKKNETRLAEIRKNISRSNRVKQIPFVNVIEDNDNINEINGEKETDIRIGEPSGQENV